MKRSLIFELLFFVGLLALAIFSRFWLEDIPNFKPVAAMALLAGFLFQRFWLAVSLPVLAMLASDGQLGTYEAPIMFAVYGSLVVCPLLGYWVARRSDNRGYGRIGQTGLLLSGAALMSALFFVSTNLVVWTQWYEMSLSGLAACFVAAIPFAKYTLFSNMLFTVSGLLSYWFATDLVGKIWPVETSQLEIDVVQNTGT